ncbi:hypothetical protein EI94DRAFT_1714733 [Lactarius quietus]|nr:hypothetical protein EI94DRAFT_1714733 [Lactarius quietus]
MADFVQGLDASKLILVEAPVQCSPYNLPIFLFGLYVQGSQEATPNSLQAFSGFLGASVLFDIIWFTQNSQGVLVRLISILTLILKVPTFLSFAATLNSRGVSGINLGGADFGGTTVWSMPGGFSSGGREGYQSVEPEIQRPVVVNHSPPGNPPPPAPGAYQSV